jgi:hypothetical protein
VANDSLARLLYEFRRNQANIRDDVACGKVGALGLYVIRESLPEY